MLRIIHLCGYVKELQILCPQCGLPFCEEETQQAIGSMICGYIINSDGIAKNTIDISANSADIAELKDGLGKLNHRIKLLEDRINKCAKCPK